MERAILIMLVASCALSFANLLYEPRFVWEEPTVVCRAPEGTSITVNGKIQECRP